MGSGIVPATSILIGQNVRAEVKDIYLVIYVDMSRDLGLSKSSKSIKIATTGGAAVLEAAPGVKLNVNIYKPVE